jgi:hypothetical protein
MADDFETEIHEGKRYLIKYCGNEQNVIIPDNFDGIGDKAFADCSLITEVYIPANVTEIWRGAFINCNNLASVVLNEGVKIIADSAFEGCTSLNRLVLPKGIEWIGENAFRECNQLQIEIYYHHEPLKPASIVGFRGKYIYLLGEEKGRIDKLFILDEKKEKSDDEFISRLMSGMVKHLSEYDSIFSSIDEIVILKARAALCRLEYPLELLDEDKRGYIAYLMKHADLIIPFLIKTGDVASINTLVGISAIPLNNIDNYIEAANRRSQTEILTILLDFKNKTGYQESAFELKNLTNNWVTHENVDGTLTITKYLDKELDVIIPDTINGKKVKRLEGNLGSLNVSIFFPHEHLLQSVTIEEGIEVIGERTFLDCRNLKSVSLPGSITMIGKEAFAWCHSLSSMVIPESIKSIGEGAFENCFLLSNIQIPSSVINIGKNAFTSIGTWGGPGDLPDIVIHSSKGSYAIEYAKKNKIKYVET